MYPANLHVHGVSCTCRKEENLVIQHAHVFLFRHEFADYLCRPDAKQEFVSQWQASYNSLEPHLKQEEAMKAELHHRVDVRKNYGHVV